MMKNEFDSQIEKELTAYTKITQEEKDKIWNEINGNISKETRSDRKKTKKKGKKRPFLIATIAAAFLLFVGSQTNIGHAIIDQVKILFEPEKEIVQSIEGMEEEGTVNLNEGTESEYVIYVDEERYTFTKSEGKDQITAINIPDNYPYVGMDIEQFKDKEPQVILEELRGEWQDESFDISSIAQVDYPLEAISFRVKKGNNPDSEIIKYFAISNGKNGSFVFTQYFFLEAEEGHGARLSQMLKEFHLVEKES
jgi:hypothetical protein